MSYKTLETWIKEQLDDTDRKIHSFQMMRHSPGGGDDLQSEFTLPLKGKNWTEAQILRTFKGRSESYVQDKPGRHVFELRAFFEGNETHQESHTYIVEDGQYKPTGSKSAPESASLQGHMGQMMRQNENLHVIVKTMAEGIAVRALQREQWYEGVIKDKDKEVNDAFAIVREASFRQNQQEHEWAMARLSAERSANERAKMLQMAPTLLSAVTGQELPNPVGDTAVLDAAAEKLDEQKLQMLRASGMVDDEFVQFMLIRMKQVRDRKAKEAEALSKVPAGETGDVASNVLPMLRAKASSEEHK